MSELKFEDISVIVGRSKASAGAKIMDIFPIGQWTEAYEAHRFYIRIYAFSEYVEYAKVAARRAIEAVVGIKNDAFFDSSTKARGAE
jgi:hypothetical protein